jgi:putative oxidoreductase
MSKKLIYSEDYVAAGLLILRIGIGIAFVLHGFPKVFGGGAEHLAGALAKAGIPGGIVAAYLAGLAEFLGGIALIAGIFFQTGIDSAGFYHGGSPVFPFEVQ